MFQNSRENEVKMKASWSDLTVAEQLINSQKITNFKLMVYSSLVENYFI